MEIANKSVFKIYVEQEMNAQMIEIFSSFIFFIFLLGALGTFIFIFQKVLKFITQRTKTNIDDLIGNEIPLYFFDLNDKIVDYIDRIFIAALIFFTTLFIIHVVLVLYDNLFVKRNKSKFFNESITGFLRKIIIVSIWICTTIIVLSIL